MLQADALHVIHEEIVSSCVTVPGHQILGNVLSVCFKSDNSKSSTLLLFMVHCTMAINMLIKCAIKLFFN